MPLNTDAKLVENIFDLKTLEKKSTRDGFGKGVVEAGEKDDRVMVLCADFVAVDQVSGTLPD